MKKEKLLNVMDGRLSLTNIFNRYENLNINHDDLTVKVDLLFNNTLNFEIPDSKYLKEYELDEIKLKEKWSFEELGIDELHFNAHEIKELIESIFYSTDTSKLGEHNELILENLIKEESRNIRYPNGILVLNQSNFQFLENINKDLIRFEEFQKLESIAEKETGPSGITFVDAIDEIMEADSVVEYLNELLAPPVEYSGIYDDILTVKIKFLDDNAQKSKPNNKM